MSYSSENIFPKGTKEKDLIELLKLINYNYSGSWKADEIGTVKSFFWFDKEDYKSWTGIELSIYQMEDQFHVGTKTPISRSYYDLKHQNKTIQLQKSILRESSIPIMEKVDTLILTLHLLNTQSQGVI